MGWASGSGLMSDIIEEIENIDGLNHDLKIEVYKVMIEKFEDHDCDTLDECVDDSKAFEEAYYDLYPERREDDLEDYEDEDE